MFTDTHYNIIDTLIAAVGEDKFYAMRAARFEPGFSRIAGLPPCAEQILISCFNFMEETGYRFTRTPDHRLARICNLTGESSGP